MVSFSIFLWLDITFLIMKKINYFFWKNDNNDCFISPKRKKTVLEKQLIHYVQSWPPDVKKLKTDCKKRFWNYVQTNLVIATSKLAGLCKKWPLEETCSCLKLYCNWKNTQWYWTINAQNRNLILNGIHFTRASSGITYCVLYEMST